MALDRVVAICLRKSPDARFQSALELIEALDGADGPFPTAPARPPEPRDVEGADAPSRTTADHPARWWWQFHQGATTVAYLLLLGPLWGARHLGSDTFGMWLFLAGLVAVIVAGALRLHLWFAARQYPEDWAAQHTVSRRWIRAADLVFTAVLLVGGIRAIRSEAPAALLVAAASAVAVSSTIIEPATTRAAFGRH
jgi:hypothetical protein